MKCICEQCGNEFDGRTNKGVASKYCSRDCWYKAHVSKKPTLVCKNCGNAFVPKHYSKSEHRKDHIVKYCSTKCANEGKKKGVIRICKVCGKEFKILPCELKKAKGLYCSWACQRSTKRNTKKLICQFCGKEFERRVSWTKGNQGKFCSRECKDLGQQYLVGSLNPNYRPDAQRQYCEKWTADLRRRVRAFFNNTCMMCGVTQDEYYTNSGKPKLLHVHHVNYNKNQCCDESVPRLLIPLCVSCHNKTTVKREIWEPILTKLIMNNYGGKCFYTKEEYKQYLIDTKTLNNLSDYPIVTGGENLV